MSRMTKDDALRLIRMTIYEFHRDVMIPLDKNIHLYDKERNKYAIHLHEQFKTFSNAVDDLYSDVTDGIKELDDAQLSELLQLCKDISELYNLPVLGSMPVDCTIGLDNTNETSEVYAERLAEVNIKILNKIIEKLESENINLRHLRTITNILNPLNPGDEGRTILDEIERYIQMGQDFVPRIPNRVKNWPIIRSIVCAFMNIRTLVPDERNREVIDRFFNEFLATDIPAAWNLTPLIERRDRFKGIVVENGDLPEEETESSLITFRYNIFSPWVSASLNLGDTTIEATFDLFSTVSTLVLTQVVQNDTSFIFTLRYRIIGNSISGNAGVIHNLNVTGGLSRFSFRGSYEYTDNDLVIRFDAGARLLLNNYSSIDLSGSLTALGNNSGGAIGVDYTRNIGGGGRFNLGGGVEINNNDVTTNFSFQIEQGNSNIGGGIRIPSCGSDALRFFLKARIRF